MYVRQTHSKPKQEVGKCVYDRPRANKPTNSYQLSKLLHRKYISEEQSKDGGEEETRDDSIDKAIRNL